MRKPAPPDTAPDTDRDTNTKPMSLRAFHIVFIIVTTALSLFVAGWGIRQFAAERSQTGLTLGILFLITAVALVIYGKKAFVKLRELP